MAMIIPMIIPPLSVLTIAITLVLIAADIIATAVVM